MRGKVEELVGFVSYLVKNHCGVPASVDVEVLISSRSAVKVILRKVLNTEDAALGRVCGIEHYLPIKDLNDAKSWQGLIYSIGVHVAELLAKLKEAEEQPCAAK